MTPDVTPLLTPGTPVIQSYKNNVFVISGERYAHDVIVTPQGVAAWDGSFENLPAHDVLIYGTGVTQVWPEAKLRASVPMEVMTTPAACRTYNALISDGRAVTALLKACAGS